MENIWEGAVVDRSTTIFLKLWRDRQMRSFWEDSPLLMICRLRKRRRYLRRKTMEESGEIERDRRRGKQEVIDHFNGIGFH